MFSSNCKIKIFICISCIEAFISIRLSYLKSQYDESLSTHVKADIVDE